MPDRAGLDPDRGNYVLGTGDVELERLGLQHRVWRGEMMRAWREAGLREGMRVVDVGAGPGYAALELAELVGPSGSVVAVERSAHFVTHLRRASAERGARNLEIIEADLMEAPSLSPGFDLAWCRWVASFVTSPALLVGWIHRVLRPGGRVVFHEYGAYEAWRFLPPRPRLESFVAEVMASWRAHGGEPNVAAALVGLLADARFRVTRVKPLLFAAAPGEAYWRWPAAFVESGLERLVELERVDAAWAAEVASELRAAEASADSRMLTPLVIEIVAEHT